MARYLWRKPSQCSEVLCSTYTEEGQGVRLLDPAVTTNGPRQVISNNVAF